MTLVFTIFWGRWARALRFAAAGLFLAAPSPTFAQPSVPTARPASLAVPADSSARLHANRSSLTLAEVVQTTLHHGVRARASQERIVSAQGRLRAARGAFDPEVVMSVQGGLDNTLYPFEQRRQLGIPKAQQGISSYDLGVSKRFRSGLTVQPAVSVVRTDPLTLSTFPMLRREARLTLTYPLVWGGAPDEIAATVDAERRSVAAAHLDLRHALALSLRDAAIAYWDYLGAGEQLRVAIDSEARARRLLTETRELVDGGEQPRAVLGPLRANLADKMSIRIEVEQGYRETRRALGLAMGMQATEIAALAPPADAFPQADSTSEALDASWLAAQALAHRSDLRSAQTAVEAEGLRLRAQESATRSRFDVQASAGYAGLSEGDRLRALHHTPPLGGEDIGGMSVSLSLRYRWPLSNDRARGRMIEQEGVYRQQQIRTWELTQRAASGVAVAIDRFHSTRMGIWQTSRAVTLHRLSVRDERKRLRHGMSTLLDVITIEDRLTRALSSQIDAQVRYAKALVQLRYETGTLLLPDARKRGAAVADAHARRLSSPPTAARDR